ncbi:prolyl endopeptidase-like [Discoglossus pictus]
MKIWMKMAVYRHRITNNVLRKALQTSTWSYKTKLKCPQIRTPRGYSTWQDLLDSERKHWQTGSTKYKDLAATLKQQLEVIHENHPTSLEREMIRHGDYTYFEENGCIYRLQPKNEEESFEILLHLEDLGFNDHQIQRIRVSPDQMFLAAGFKSSESEESTCIILKLKNKLEITHYIPNVFSFEWASDGILFHTRQENLHCHQVYMTDLNNKTTSKLVYTEHDPRFFVDLYTTRDKTFLTINSNSKTTSEVWLIDRLCPLEPPVLVRQRIPGMIYHVEHSNGYLYILTTYGKPAEYKLMKTPCSFPMEDWKLFYKVKENTKLVDMEILKDYCVMFLKHYNWPYLEVVSLSTGSTIQSIKLPAWACSFEFDQHPKNNTDFFNFYLTSPVQRPVLFVYSLKEHRLSADANYKIADKSTYRTERLEAKSKDGTMVPITVLYKTCSRERSQKPLLIHIYGAYGMDLNMSFKAEKRMVIDDGWILAYCHVRGGGELGFRWHKDGILDKKQNGVDDLFSCIAHLHELGYSQNYYTAVEASSAGGVLAGALYNSNPQLFQAMALEAPFLDVLNTMMDTSLPLTIEEQEEWGNPITDQKFYEYIRTYCPYQNITPQHYPSLLITAYKNDQRIPLEGLLRFMGKLRKAAADYCHSSDMSGLRTSNIFLDVHPGGSHCDSLSWEDSLQKVAMHLAFLYTELKLEEENNIKKKH